LRDSEATSIRVHAAVILPLQPELNTFRKQTGSLKLLSSYPYPTILVGTNKN